MISAILLAAGLSKRMEGENKLLLPFRNNKNIIQTVVDELIASSFDEIIVVAGHDSEKIIESIKDRNVKTVLNRRYQSGMTTSIQEGIINADPKSGGYLICLGDQPLLETVDYLTIKNNFNNYKKVEKIILVPTYQGNRGNPVTFSSSYKEQILNHKEMSGCKAILQANSNHIRELEIANAGVITDIDTTSDYRGMIE